MEEIKGSGLYLRKNAKGGYGVFLKKQKTPVKLLNRSLYNYELVEYAKCLKIYYFRGVFM